MRKILLLSLISVSLLFSGCGKFQATADAPAFTERAMQTVQSDFPHIFDECQVLSQQQISEMNHELTQLSTSRMMNAFLVLTNHLDGISPEQFAQNYYQAVADSTIPDGFLILINNDTNQDYFFTTGKCDTFISPTEKETAISGATFSLIEQDYSSAMEILFPVAETVPAYVFDQTNTLTVPEMQEFSGKLQTIQQESNIQGCLLFMNFPENEETPLPDPETYREQIGCDVLLLLDPKKEGCFLSGELPEFSNEEFEKIRHEQSLPWAIRYFLEKIS